MEDYVELVEPLFMEKTKLCMAAMEASNIFLVIENRGRKEIIPKTIRTLSFSLKLLFILMIK